MHTKRKGDVSEQKVITRLIELGVDVFTPVGENTRADLIYSDDTGLNRVQVKTGRYNNGSVVFNCSKVHSNSTSHTTTNYVGDVDCFIVYSPKFDSFYYINIDEAPEKEMWIRVDDLPKHSPKKTINWESEHKLEDYIEVDD